MVFHGENLISWSCKQQQTVAKSSTEAEYKALSTPAAELQWLQSLIQTIHFSISGLPQLWCDNIGATYLSANPIFQARTKHIEIDFHHVRELVLNKQLQVCFISSKDQLADLLTKPLSSTRFKLLKTNLHVQELPMGLRGRVEEDLCKQKKYSRSALDNSATR